MTEDHEIVTRTVSERSTISDIADYSGGGLVVGQVEEVATIRKPTVPIPFSVIYEESQSEQPDFLDDIRTILFSGYINALLILHPFALLSGGLE
jgi:hypothetical protein